MKGNVPVLQYHNEVLICTLITGHGIVIGKERSDRNVMLVVSKLRNVTYAYS